MVEVKLLIFAHVRDSLSENPEICVKLDKSEWENDVELKKYMTEYLLKRWQDRQLTRGTCNISTIEQPDRETLNPNDFMLAINEDYISPGSAISLNENDRIALIPPVSGG